MCIEVIIFTTEAQRAQRGIAINHVIRRISRSLDTLVHKERKKKREDPKTLLEAPLHPLPTDR
ncbi:hypothetical protein NIES4071_80350 [Calothrix sp. NIES-4071]|nr:hypothetical protein NIES4071_80350 [Calothrix sp. NIES-4071]BAZ62305.1 hypothetical protein NIES4105_80280 [Calothrix sp. NIES-4105]